MKYELSDGDWVQHLSEAVNLANLGDTIVVSSEAKRQLAMRALERMGKMDIEVRVASPDDKSYWEWNQRNW